MKQEMKIIAYSGAISADYIEGPDFDNDCYSQWTHPEYTTQVESDDFVNEIKSFMIRELSADLSKDFLTIDDEVIMVTTLVNDVNLRPTFSDFRKWIKKSGEIWVKDTSIEVYINDELISFNEEDFITIK